MNNAVDKYIKDSLKKEGDIWLSLAKEKAKQYPQESLRQITIRAMVNYFETKFPDVMEEFDTEIKKKKELSKNEYSVDKDTELRRVSAVPDGLMTRINQALQQHGWTRFLSNEAQKEFKELDWFANEFPRYTIAEKY